MLMTCTYVGTAHSSQKRGKSGNVDRVKEMGSYAVTIEEVIISNAQQTRMEFSHFNCQALPGAGTKCYYF